MLKVTVCVLTSAAKMTFVEAGSSVEDVVEVLGYDVEELEGMDMTINGRPVDAGLSEEVKDNDIVLFVPPVEGGSK